ncbi:MAG: S8 family serine peptidase [Clostridia bacterium]|nr:S8 family serine peptidase [Clostridia bacterium]
MLKFKRVSLLMSIVILIASVCPSVNASDTLQQASDTVIDTKLRAILSDSTATDQIPVDVWLYDPVSSEELEKEISSRIGTTREQLTTNKDRSATSKEIDTYIETERTLYAEKMNQHYDKLLKDYSNVKALCETREGKRLFFSQYAPLISAELTPKEIKKLAADSRVESIYYSPDAEMVDESDVSLPTIGADYTRDTLGYTGSGIKIGMIESGLPRNPYASNIVCESTDSANYTDHASAVAAIMMTQVTPYNRASYEGIVPDATLYATYTTGRDWRIGVEWLLSQGVHVINMSSGFYDNLGQYDNRAKWVDHIAMNHSVHFVKASGRYSLYDNPQNQISSPGMAYNAITVGAINDQNTTSYTDDEFLDGSSWNESIGTQEPSGTNKPDLVAPGVNIITDIRITEDNDNDGVNEIGNYYVASGTSFAAPHVTAVVAQLCQRKPELKLLQDTVKAILTASVSHSDIRYNTMDDITNNYDTCGAGVVNAKSACSTVIHSRYASGSFAANSGNGTQVVYTFNVTDTTKLIRVSLSWLKYSVFSEEEENHYSYDLTSGTLANLNLYIFDSEGRVVYNNEEVLSNNVGINTEIVEFKAARTGTHRIYVRQTKQSNKPVHYGVAWWHPIT